MLSSKDIAEYFLAQTDEEAGDTLSNLKVQKLVYYAQGFHLALYDTPLFSEDIEAWQHGPVVPSLYREYRNYGAGSIPAPTAVDFDKFSVDVRALLDDVYNVYGQYSPWKLRQMTHEESPWQDAYRDNAQGATISKSAMKEFFRGLLVR